MKSPAIAYIVTYLVVALALTINVTPITGAPRIDNPFTAPAFPIPLTSVELCAGAGMDPYCEGSAVNCPADVYWDDDNCIGYDDTDYLSCYCTNAPGTGTPLGAIWICTVWYPQ